MGERRINSFSSLSWSDHQTRGRGGGREGKKRGERNKKWKKWGYLAELTSGHNGHEVTVSDYLSLSDRGEREEMAKSMRKMKFFFLYHHMLYICRGLTKFLVIRP